MVAAAQSILVADDDESMRILLARVLGDQGYQVTCAHGGAEAIRRLRETPPDLVILDLLMPGVTGWDVLEVLRGDPRLAPIPVVVVTADGERADAPAGRPVIHKPLDCEVLDQVVADLLGVTRQGRTRSPHRDTARRRGRMTRST
jgi:CheY-like chemotaxis protein